MFKGDNFGIYLIECKKHLLLSVHDLLDGPWKDQQILLTDETEASETNQHKHGIIKRPHSRGHQRHEAVQHA